jgi:hypothetical protein
VPKQPGLTELQETAELVAAFVRVPTTEQAQWEAVARRVLGDVPQRLLLDRAAHLWDRGGLPVITVVMSHHVRHLMAVVPIRVHRHKQGGQWLWRDAGGLLCVAPSWQRYYPGTPRPVEDEPTCRKCISMAAAHTPQLGGTCETRPACGNAD